MDSQRISEEVNAFFNAFGAQEEMRRLFESSSVKEIIHKTHEEILRDISSIRDKSPKMLKKKAQKMYVVLEDDKFETLFAADVENNFKINLMRAIEALPEFILYMPGVKDSIKRGIVEGNGLLDLKDILEAMKSHIRNAYIQDLYKGYIPDELPPAVANLIREMGGICIPGNVLFANEDQND